MIPVKEVASRICTLLREIMPELPAEIEFSASFDVLGVDSLNFTDLLMAVEKEFDVEIPDSELPALANIAEIANFITAALRTR